MTIDITRYPLLTQEYRYAVVAIPGVAAIYAKAKELEIDSAFRAISSTLATAIANIVGVPKRRLEITITGCDTVGVDSFKSQTPTAQIVAPELNVNGLYVITRAQINEDDNNTVLEAWG